MNLRITVDMAPRKLQRLGLDTAQMHRYGALRIRILAFVIGCI